MGSTKTPTESVRPATRDASLVTDPPTALACPADQANSSLVASATAVTVDSEVLEPANCAILAARPALTLTPASHVLTTPLSAPTDSVLATLATI